MGMRMTALTAAFAAALFLAAGPAQAAEDLNAVYQQGRAAFYRGDYPVAQQLLSRVAAANPKHADTNNMLAYIRAYHKPVDATLKNQYAAVILPKVELAEVTLAEALDGIRALAKNASDGKVQPNFIIKGEEVGQRKVTLSLSKVPLTEVLEYVTQLTSTKAVYQQHAVILTSTADTASSTAEAPIKATTK